MNTPNTIQISTLARIAAGAFLLTACGPGVVVETGVVDTEHETETDVGPVPADMPDESCGLDAAECADGDVSDLMEECDDDGRCWVRRAWWSSWAQASDPEGIAAGLDAGTLTPSEQIGEASCFAYGEPGGTICVLGVDGVDLHALPLSELTSVSELCAGVGPWTNSFRSTFWCYGRFGSLGVALREG